MLLELKMSNSAVNVLCSYDDLHWEPGLWEADIKMQFIREIWWHVEQQRGSVKLIELRETEKGKVLNSIRRPLGIIECIRKLAEPEKAARIVEATLLDSVRHLRDSVVAHHGGSINAYQGAKVNVSSDLLCVSFNTNIALVDNMFAFSVGRRMCVTK